MSAAAACPVCGAPWSRQEAERAARRLLERLADEVNAATQTTPPADGIPQAAVEPAAPEETAGGVPNNRAGEVRHA